MPEKNSARHSSSSASSFSGSEAQSTGSGGLGGASPSPRPGGSPAPDDIMNDIHERFRNLPDAVKKRRSDARNRYMRGYMAGYRNRRHRVTLTLRPDRYDRFVREANALGRPLAAFFPEAAEAYLGKRSLYPKDLVVRFDRTLYEINRIGVNINQIAHHCNARKNATPDDLAFCRQALEFLKREVSRVLSPPSGPPGSGPGATSEAPPPG